MAVRKNTPQKSAAKSKSTTPKSTTPKVAKSDQVEKSMALSATDAQTQPVVPIVNKKTMLARVAARAELRPNQAKAVYEAVLQELGDALLNGEKLKLPPLGTVKVNRHKELPNADVVVCKVRRNKKKNEGDAPISSAAE